MATRRKPNPHFVLSPWRDLLHTRIATAVRYALFAALILTLPRFTAADDSVPVRDFLERVEAPKPPRTRPIRRHSRNEVGEINGLQLRGVALQPDDFAVIGEISSLESIDLSETDPRAADLQHLSGLDKLRDLTLRGTKIGGEGLSQLSMLKNLTTLDLSRTDVADEDLHVLKRFESLKHLVLNGTRITDAGLVHLAQLQRLETLRLGDTEITDAGVPHLAAMNLQGLTLNETQITPRGMKILAKAPPFTWMESPQATIEELVRRLEAGNAQGVLDMYTWGPYFPRSGELQVQKIEPQSPTNSDIDKQRQRFRIELRRISLLDNLNDRLFAVILVDRGTVAVAEIGLIEE